VVLQPEGFYRFVDFCRNAPTTDTPGNSGAKLARPIFKLGHYPQPWALLLPGAPGRLAQGEHNPAFRKIIIAGRLGMTSDDEPMESTRARGEDLESHGCARHAPATHLCPRVQAVAGSGFSGTGTHGCH
jgi:hypothetical protein